MKPVALFLCLVATATIAQPNEWQGLSKRVLTDFEQAMAEERVIPFVTPNEHPAMVAASAAYLNLEPEAYRERVHAGYRYSIQNSDVTSFRWGEISTGSQPMNWTVASYETVVEVEGRMPVVSCVRLVVYGDIREHFLTVLGTELSEELFVKAVPELARVARDHPANCQ